MVSGSRVSLQSFTVPPNQKKEKEKLELKCAPISNPPDQLKSLDGKEFTLASEGIPLYMVFTME